ncbi:MAG: thiamine phosphate synthase [Planctomycetes bacterium]|nr:thiamine phosphate synthase [Planctomycetota bacterium]
MPVDFAFYLMTDRALCKPKTLPVAVDNACRAGVRAVGLREKDLSARDLHDLAKRVKSMTDRHEALLIIHDRADIAAAVGAAGVHLDERGIPVEAARAILGHDAIIGAAAGTLEAAVVAEGGGANFITFGPIFQTRTDEPYPTPVGPGSLERVAARVSIPVFATGGISPERVAECMRAGARGIAAVSAILAAPHIKTAVRTFRDAIGAL